MFTLKLTLQDASEQYVEYLRSQTHRRADRHAKYVLKMLLLAAQDIEVSQLEGKHIGAFWDVQRYWPRNAAAYRDTISDADLMLSGLNEKSGPVSPSTIRITAQRLFAFFRWLESQNLIVMPPQLLRALRNSISRPLCSVGSANSKGYARSISVISRRPFVRGGGGVPQPVSLYTAIAHFQRASTVDGLNADCSRHQSRVMNLFLQSCGVIPVAEIGDEQINAFVSIFQDPCNLEPVLPLLELQVDYQDGRGDVGRALGLALADADQVLARFFNWLWVQGTITKLPSQRYRARIGGQGPYLSTGLR